MCGFICVCLCVFSVFSAAVEIPRSVDLQINDLQVRQATSSVQTAVLSPRNCPTSNCPTDDGPD